jgi:hypothetical protein
VCRRRVAASIRSTRTPVARRRSNGGYDRMDER